MSKKLTAPEPVQASSGPMPKKLVRQWMKCAARLPAPEREKFLAMQLRAAQLNRVATALRLRAWTMYHSAVLPGRPEGGE